MSESHSETPPLAIGHVSLAVSNVEASYGFYTRLGLRPFLKDDQLGILELRGGTHLLLFPREAGAPAPERARMDLMIAGRSREALESFRTGLAADGLSPQAIPDENRFGHFTFRTEDPDGNEVVVYTSHAGELPV